MNNRNNWRRLPLNPCACGCGEVVAKRFKKGHGRRRPIAERLMEKVSIQPNGCWIWTGAADNGYGRIGTGSNSTAPAHRVSYALSVRPLREDEHLDHLCHNKARARGECPGGPGCIHRRCVNPAHLDPVAQAENNRRMGDARRRARSGERPAPVAP